MHAVTRTQPIQHAGKAVEPYLDLSAAIVEQAVLDYRAGAKGRSVAEHRGPIAYRSAVTFFESSWFELICGTFGVDPDQARRAVRAGCGRLPRGRPRER